MRLCASDPLHLGAALCLLLLPAPLAAGGGGLGEIVEVQAALRSVRALAEGSAEGPALTRESGDARHVPGRFAGEGGVSLQAVASPSALLIGRGDAAQDSNITPEILGGYALAVASLYSLGAESGGVIEATSELRVRLALGRRIRYLVSYRVEAKGDAEPRSSFEITGRDGDVIREAASGEGARREGSEGGWLPAGEVRISLYQGARAAAAAGEIAAAQSRGTFELQLFCPGDADLSGAVNGADEALWRGAFSAGDLLADMDGDGALGPQDLEIFEAAFAGGC